jgi:hypothetical protein
MDRNDSFTYPERLRLYHSHVQYWLAVLDHFRPNVVVFPAAPHLIYDYVLFELCRRKDVKTIIFIQTAFDPYIYPVEEFELHDTPIKSMYENILKSEKNNNQKVPLSKEALYHLQKMSGDPSNVVNFYLKVTLDKQHIFRYVAKRMINNPNDISKMIEKGKYLFSRGNYIKERGRKIEDSNIKGWKYLFCKLEGIQKKNQLHRHYNTLTQNPYLNNPYVYVPLHYQPEATTSPAGGVFADQLIMVDLLSKCVPEGWSVYVREHPVQFKTIGSRGECSRTIDFYDDLASLSNVKLLPIPASNIDLIDHSEAVATVTGTGGWEALLREKPVLVFGYAWYKDCKGVFSGLGAS